MAAAKRTAIGKLMGGLSSLSPGELGAEVIKDIISQTRIDPAGIDEVIVGNILSAGQRQGVGRQAAVKGGVPVEVPAYSLNMMCGSGMKAVMTGYTEIAAGMAEMVLAGGVESMSGAGFVMPGSIRGGHKMGAIEAADHMVCDGLTDAFNNYHMGITAENIAEKYSISREAQDAFAYASQTKAIEAVDRGEFKEEIVPVEIAGRKETAVFDTDEFPNRSSNPQKLSLLKPAFKKDGTVTAGNASGVNDGAAFLLLASEAKAKVLGLEPLAEIVAVGQAGTEPEVMGLGPVGAIRNALKAASMKLTDIDLIELNEAFAAQSLGVIKLVMEEHGVNRKWIDERTNVNGGAIALGHPIGASGARILVSLIHAMRKRGKKTGLASLCIGGGMGTAVIVKIS